MDLRDSCACAWEILPVSIASGEFMTGFINLGGLRLFGVAIPASWTAASLSYQVSPDAGTTWFDLLDETGSAVTTGTASSGCSMVDPRLFSPFQYVRIRSGLAASPVAQTAPRTVQLFLRSI